MQHFFVVSVLLFLSAAPLRARAQNQSSIGGTVAKADGIPLSGDYPRNTAGVLIEGKEWTDIASQTPSKTKVAHGIAAGFSYGLVPGKVVAEYDGEHSATRTTELQPLICVCHFNSLPGSPVLVRLHAKKGARELDGGRMTVYPIVGGSKSANANKTDLVAADVSQPESRVWLVRPQTPLDPGEYALMLGTQNVMIFPFTVENASGPANP
jgi:hypothetical protein